MEHRGLRIFLSGVSLIVLATTSAAAQDVVMRRPLPSTATQGAGVATPTPSPTPTPTPSPTDAAEPTDVTPLPTPNYSPTSAYGWSLDCQTHKASCVKVDNGYDSTSYWNPVDDSECPATQSSDAEQLASAAGLVPVAEGGVQHGLQYCTAHPQGTQVLYSGGLYCNTSTSKITYECDRLIADQPFSAVSVSAIDASDHCAAQQETSEYDAASSYWWGSSAVDPSGTAAAAAQNGQACKGDGNYNTYYGAVCQPDGSYTCSSVSYYSDPLNGPTINDISRVNASNCAQDQSVDAFGRQVLSQLGYLPGGTDVASLCSPTGLLDSGGLYGAEGKCVTKTTYNPDGSTDISSSYVAQCYAVYYPTDPNRVTAQPTALSNCEEQTSTPEQTSELAALSPALSDYHALMANKPDCSIIPLVQINYDRPGYAADRGATFSDPTQYGSDAVDAATPQGDGSLDYGDRSAIAETYTDIPVPQNMYWGGACAVWRVERDWKLPYVCTDATPGSYYSSGLQGMMSTYNNSDEPCLAQRQNDISKMQPLAASYGQPDDGGMLGAFGAVHGPGEGMTITDEAGRSDIDIHSVSYEVRCVQL